MSVILAKYTRFRRAPFRLETTLHQNEDVKTARKRALTPEARGHIQAIARNHDHMNEAILDPSTVKVNRIIDQTEDSVTFEHVKGVSLENVLFQSFKNDDHSGFESVIEEYHSLLFNQFRKSNSPQLANDSCFAQSPETFDELKGLVSFFPKTNIDLTPDNIKKTSANVYEIIDYEWVVDDALPVSYIFYRGLFFFYRLKYFDFNLDNFVPLKSVLDNYGVTATHTDAFDAIESSFQRHVRGSDETFLGERNYEKRKYFLPKDNPFQSLHQSSLPDISTLYYDIGEGFDETHSVKVDTHSPLDQPTPFHVTFSLPSTNVPVRMLRWDPFERACGIVEIFKVVIIDDDGVGHPIQLDELHSNGELLESGKFLFPSLDPNILVIPATPLDALNLASLEIQGSWTIHSPMKTLEILNERNIQLRHAFIDMEQTESKHRDELQRSKMEILALREQLSDAKQAQQ